MADLPEVPDFDEAELIDYAKNFESRARDNAPTTVKLSYGGTVIGAVAFGPAGAVVGATLGSSVGYLVDEDYFDSDEGPEIIEADVKDGD